MPRISPLNFTEPSVNLSLNLSNVLTYENMENDVKLVIEDICQ